MVDLGYPGRPNVINHLRILKCEGGRQKSQCQSAVKGQRLARSLLSGFEDGKGP